MSEQDKNRLLRETKRQIKKDGNRSRRRHLQRQIQEDPDNAHMADDYDYEYNSSTYLNGMNNDATRKQKLEEDYETEMHGQDNIEEER